MSPKHDCAQGAPETLPSNVVPFKRPSSLPPPKPACALQKPTESTGRMSPHEIRRSPISVDEEFAQLEAAGRFFVPSRPIKSRRDLSFTTQDERGFLVNWYVKPEERAEYWNNGLKVGAAFFEEVRILALQSPMDAFHALYHSYQGVGLCARGEEDGFMGAFARAAIAGILAYPQGLPEVAPKGKPKGRPRKQKEVEGINPGGRGHE